MSTLQKLKDLLAEVNIIDECEKHGCELICHECMVAAGECVEDLKMKAVVVAAVKHYDAGGCTCDICRAIAANLLELRSMI